MLAGRHRARYRPIEVVIPDQAVHRERVTRRPAGVGGKNAWPRIEAAFALYEAWAQDRLVLDSTQPLDLLVRSAVAYVRSDEL